MKTLKILIILALMSVSSYGQEKTYTRAQLQSDFTLARTALEEAHPGIYRFVSKPDLDRQFDAAYKSIPEAMTEAAFYKLLAPSVLSIGCGHTSVRLDSLFTSLQKRRLPFDIRIIGQRRVYVSKSYSDEIVAGSEIISIDGTPVLDIISSFLPYISHDGFITTGRFRSAERNFSTRLQLHHNASGTYLIAFKDGRGNTSSKNIALVPAADIPRGKEKPDLEYSVTDKTGILTIRSFGGSVKDVSGNTYREFLENSFANVNANKIENLIIDLRGNGGGNDEYGSMLFGYLADTPFKYYSYLEIDNPTISFIKYTDQSPAFRDQLAGLAVNRNGRYLFKESSHPCLPLQQPQAIHFDKKVYVLIDGGSFSATAEFASIARYKKRAFFIGEETGGAYEGNTSGYSALLTLPNTGIGIRLPMLKYVTAVERDPQPKGRGIMPDLEVNPTIEGIIAGRDEVMEQALAKAGNPSNERQK